MKQHFLHLAITLAVAAQTAGAWAATPANAQLAADNKAALARYDSDKKLCNDETSSNARLQCRRDAKAEYDQALAAAKAKAAATPAPAPAPAPASASASASAPAPVAATPAAPAAAQTAAPACAECGRVLSITVTEKAGEYSAVGVLAGGALGAVLGNQVGGGLGKDLATLAGAAGGAYAGKMIEEKIKTHKVWTVTVIYANESKASFDFTNDPGFQVGDKVRNTGSTVARM
nr:glycine zipper 2TM domain-containing protein [uncultured Rhodoferax sp.]